MERKHLRQWLRASLATSTSLLVLTLGTRTEAADLNSGLVAQYKFDGSYANALGFELVLVPTDASFQEGLQGSAASLQEAESHLESIDPFPIVGNSPRTISVWIRLEAFADEKRRLITWGSTEQESALSSVVIDNNGAAVFHTHSWDAYSAPGVITLDRWHHLVLRYDGQFSGTEFFVDGFRVPMAHFSFPGPVADAINTSSNTPLTIGYRPAIGPSGWNRAWDGFVDELRIYDRALSEGEINTLYTTGITGPDLSVSRAVALSVFGEMGTSYQVQSSLDLDAWTNVGEPIIGADEIIVVWKITSGTHRYFRLEKVVGE